MPDEIPSKHKFSMPLIAVLIALGLCVIFGGNQVASKVALQAFPPLLCAAFAFTLSSITLWIYAQVGSIDLQPPSMLVWRLHYMSAVLFILFNATALIGLKFTLASRASIFLAIHPFFVVIFNLWAPIRERITRGQIIGLSLAFVGVLIVFSERLSPQVGVSWVGDTLILIAAALLGLLIVHIRRVTACVPPIQATLWQMVLSLPMFWLATILFEYPLNIPRFSESWLGIFYMGLAVNAIAFVVRAELFRRYSANTVSTFLFLTPVIGLVLGHLFLGEPLTRAVGLGAIVVSLGVLIVYRYT
ncbi:DMT family transporter [Mastigocoleus sp. MO_188.B34]|uniref:DMT family transporter n=1 Tax=Mastigocoleus sp. MO_188.B34 TaxID=3036635 RepID=UPI0026171B41|nr:DMT family transporter [Mastigocoleus sp. MO_188.B34]MDJ0697905.1 DMT family transporter [Mastigocoleus sp. MO_188.B34]